MSINTCFQKATSRRKPLIFLVEGVRTFEMLLKLKTESLGEPMYATPKADADFDKWWTQYPKKRGKGDARLAWRQTSAIRPPIENMLEALSMACKQPQWIEEGGQYIPYPATYLRAECWDDEYEVSLPNVVGSKMWWETATGIEEKGREYGLFADKFDNFQAFKAAVFKASGHLTRVV